MTAWNDFQKAQAGKGYSQQEMAAMYRASGGGSSSSSSSSSRGGSASSYSAPPAPARTSSSSGSVWNSFQREHAGLGYSREQMSSMYHNRTTSQPQAVARPASATTSSSRSSWNQYQRDHAGQGLSSAEMAAGYRVSQSAAGEAASRRAASPAVTQRNATFKTKQSPSQAAPASSTTSSTSKNSWNEFQRAHAGQGLSQAEKLAAYKAEQQSKAGEAAERRAAAASAAAAGASQAASSTRSSASPKASSATSNSGPASTWNEFQRQHAGQGLSKRQLSLLFKQEKQTKAGPARKTSTASVSLTASSAKAARAPNAFNEFQKKYKADHPDEKLNAAQLAKIYRKEKLISQREAHEARFLSQLGSDSEDESGGTECRWENAMDAFMEERRQELADFMLEIAQLQEQLHNQDASTTQLEECGRVAQELEAEEANLNLKSYVNHHEVQLAVAMSLENPTEHARHAKSLSECELIDSSRLELAVEDGNRIGSGGFGSVYIGMLDSMIPVAVKIVDGMSSKDKAKFEQELLAMMRASAHENVLRVYGYAVVKDDTGRQSFGIVMELMPGGDLAFALRDESVTLDERKRLDLLLQVIQSIEYLHADGITHRDIKPQNVLLSADLKTAKLADFGLAGVKNKTMSSRRTDVTYGTSAHVAMGLTPPYAAPEVIEGKLSFRDTAWKKSDIYSFTVMLAQVLMDKQPWEYESPQYIMNAVAKQAKRPFDPEDISVSGSVERNARLHSLIRNGWDQDPAVRPTATEMRERLEKIIATERSAEEREPQTIIDGHARGPLPPASSKPTSVSSPRGVDSLWGGARNGHHIVYEGDEFFDAA